MNSETTQVHISPPSYAPLSAPQQSFEKGPAPLLPGRVAVYPGYNTMSQYPADNFPPPRQRRSRARVLLSRAVHTVILLVAFVLLFPIFMRGVAHVSRAVSTILCPGRAFSDHDHRSAGVTTSPLKLPSFRTSVPTSHSGPLRTPILTSGPMSSSTVTSTMTMTTSPPRPR